MRLPFNLLDAIEMTLVNFLNEIYLPLKALVVTALVFIGFAGSASASPPPVPEINPASGGSALALIAAGLLVIRGRRR